MSERGGSLRDVVRVAIASDREYAIIVLVLVCDMVRESRVRRSAQAQVLHRYAASRE